MENEKNKNAINFLLKHSDFTVGLLQWMSERAIGKNTKVSKKENGPEEPDFTFGVSPRNWDMNPEYEVETEGEILARELKSSKHEQEHMYDQLDKEEREEIFKMDWIFGCLIYNTPIWKQDLERLAKEYGIVLGYQYEDIGIGNTIIEKIFRPALTNEFVSSFKNNL